MCSFSRDYPTPATDARQVANYDCNNRERMALAQLVKRGESWRLWSRGEERHSAAWRRYALMIPLISARQEPQFVPACRACPIASTVTQPALAAAAI